MERQLPIYTIEGTDFEVDVKQQLLKEVSAPDNIIHFIQMKDHGTHYSLTYDLEGRNLPGLGDPFVTVDIPPLKDLDPEGMAEHFGYKQEELAGKTDFEIIVDQEALAERLTGRQPMIEFIPGHEYYVALHWGLLEPTDLMYDRIKLDDIDYCFIEELNKYWITYDPESRKVIDLDTAALVQVPNNLTVLEIPGDSKLDPYRYAIKYGLDYKQILRENPIEMKMKARVVPWEETAVDHLIERNIKKLSGGMTNAVINGKLYILDQDRQALVGATDRNKIIDLKGMDMNPEATEYMCFFETSKDIVVHPNDQNRQLPNLVMMVIPNPFLSSHRGQTIKVKEVPTLSRSTRIGKNLEHDQPKQKQQHKKGRKI